VAQVLGAEMKLRRPRYVQAFIDRHGKPRFYLRKPGCASKPLPGLPWTPTFMAAYEEALKGEWSKREIGAKRTVAGSVSAGLVAYYESRAFKELAPLTQKNRRAILESFRNEHGHRPMPIPSEILEAIIDKKTPAAQRNFKKAMRGFVDYCLTKKLQKTDPLAGIKLSRMRVTGHHTWTLDEIAQYRERFAPGTTARLALELLLQTGHARADVVRMGPQHVKGGKLSMRRQKTGVQFDIPLLPALTAELALHPIKQLAYLTTSYGKPFTAAGFGNWFRERCNEAGLRHCSAHGLRKAAAVTHALNDATAPQLMAWFGWRTIGEAQRYIEQADRIKLAEASGARLIQRTGDCQTELPVCGIEAKRQ
jgi:integrase